MREPHPVGASYLGRRVHDARGTRLGRVDDVLLDARSACPQWLVIRLPGILSRRRGAPLLLAVEGVDGLVLPLTHQALRRSPPLPWRAHLTAVQELALRRYWMDH